MLVGKIRRHNEICPIFGDKVPHACMGCSFLLKEFDGFVLCGFMDHVDEDGGKENEK